MKCIANSNLCKIFLNLNLCWEKDYERFLSITKLFLSNIFAVINVHQSINYDYMVTCHLIHIPFEGSNYIQKREWQEMTCQFTLLLYALLSNLLKIHKTKICMKGGKWIRFGFDFFLINELPSCITYQMNIMSNIDKSSNYQEKSK